MPTALPSTYGGLPVIPLAPNLGGDRDHEWDWPAAVTTIPSGVTTVATNPTVGTEAIPLAYTGLSRADARTLEAFFEARAGRKDAFWCPTFQRDFAVVSASGSVQVREYGYADDVWPLGSWATQFAFYRPGAGWLLSSVYGFNAPGTDADGTPTLYYNVEPINAAGSFTVIDSGVGLAVMRLLKVRFADDAITTEWTHPNFASITLRVVQVPS